MKIDHRKLVKIIFLAALFSFFISGLLCDELKIKVIVDNANIRLKPNFESQVIQQVQLGIILQSLGKLKEWYRVNLPPDEDGIIISGFIHRDFVQEIQEKVEEMTKVEEKKPMIFPPPLQKPTISKRAEAQIEKEMKPKAAKRRNNSIKVRANYFSPSEQSFKNMYGGGITIGGEINIKIWKFIGLWLIGNHYSKKGSLPFTKESTEMTLIPIGGGLKLRFQSGVINPYIGIGPVIYIYEEKNPIGAAKGSKAGIIGQAGCYFRIIGGLLFDVSINYSYCKVKPQKIKADLGGIQAGIGLGFEF